MSRQVKGDRTPKVEKVENIDLSDKHFKLRLIAVILAIILGVAAFGYGVHSIVTKEPGWYEVNANSDKMTCADDFSFYYRVGLTSRDATVELKIITSLYTSATEEAYEIFNALEEFDNVHNVYYLNHNINTKVEISSTLYNAFKLINEYNDKTIFLGPIFEYYSNMFMCQNDYEILPFDPIQNETISEYYQCIANYINDISIELLDNNIVELRVSDEYVAFAREQGIENFIDFAWMKNAFIIDYIVDVFTANNYVYGIISSNDGFVRSFDSNNDDHSFTLISYKDKIITNTGKLLYKGNESIVYLHNYAINNADAFRIYMLEDGTSRNSYLNYENGINLTACSELIAYSKDKRCSEIILSISPIYISENLDTNKLSELSPSINSIFFEDKVLKYTDKDINIQLADTYSIELIK